MSAWILVVYMLLPTPWAPAVVVYALDEATCFFYRDYALQLSGLEVDEIDRVTSAECISQ